MGKYSFFFFLTYPLFLRKKVSDFLCKVLVAFHVSVYMCMCLYVFILCVKTLNVTNKQVPIFSWQEDGLVCTSASARLSSGAKWKGQVCHSSIFLYHMTLVCVNLLTSLWPSWYLLFKYIKKKKNKKMSFWDETRIVFAFCDLFDFDDVHGCSDPRSLGLSHGLCVIIYVRPSVFMFLCEWMPSH